MSWNTLQPFATWLGQSWLGQWMGQSTARIGWLLTLHLVGITLLLGGVILASLHLFGLFLPTVPTPRVRQTLLPVMLGGLLLALVTGTLTFIGGEDGYFVSEWFRTKMELLAVALIFQATVFWWSMGVERSRRPAIVGVLTGLVALGLWFGVAFSGRAIAYF